MKLKIRDYVLISIGVALAVAGLNIFLVPGKIAAGGVSGIATILYHLFRIPLGISIIVLNIPLFIFGLKLLGKTFAIRTVYALLLYSALAEVIRIPEQAYDPFLASIYGGVLVGVGIGLVVKFGATTGGTDMAAKILSERFRHVSLSVFLFGIDFVIIAAAGILFDMTVAMYAVVSLFVASKVIDFVVAGLSAAKAFYIISDKSERDIARHTVSDEQGRDSAVRNGAVQQAGQGRFAVRFKVEDGGAEVKEARAEHRQQGFCYRC